MHSDPVSFLTSPNTNFLSDFIGPEGTALMASVSKQVLKCANSALNKVKDKLLQDLTEAHIDKECANSNLYELKKRVANFLLSQNGFVVPKYLRFPVRLPLISESILKMVVHKNAFLPKINENLFNFFNKLAEKCPEAKGFKQEVEPLPPLEKARKIHEWLKENGPKLDSKIIDSIFIENLGNSEEIPFEFFYLNLSSEVINNWNVVQSLSSNNCAIFEKLFRSGKYFLITKKENVGVMGWYLFEFKSSIASNVITVSVMKEYLIDCCPRFLNPFTSNFNDYKKEEVEEIFRHLCDKIEQNCNTEAKGKYIEGALAILNSKKIAAKKCTLTCSDNVYDAIFRFSLRKNILKEVALEQLPSWLIIYKFLEDDEASSKFIEDTLGKCSALEIQTFFDEACQDIADPKAQELLRMILAHHSDKIFYSHLVRNLSKLLGINTQVTKTVMVGWGVILALDLSNIFQESKVIKAATSLGACFFFATLRNHAVLPTFAKGLVYKVWRGKKS